MCIYSSKTAPLVTSWVLSVWTPTFSSPEPSPPMSSRTTSTPWNTLCLLWCVSPWSARTLLISPSSLKVHFSRNFIFGTICQFYYCLSKSDAVISAKTSSTSCIHQLLYDCLQPLHIMSPLFDCRSEALGQVGSSSALLHCPYRRTHRSRSRRAALGNLLEGSLDYCYYYYHFICIYDC